MIMKYSCEMVQDLLPLYCDHVCSAESRKIVEAHLEECSSCSDLLKKMEDRTYDHVLEKEYQNVVGRHTSQVRRKTLTAGICTACVLAIPILACLIVNLATGHALDWFFIVLTALMVFASLTVVPLIAEEKKGLWTLGSFTVSLLLLLLTCCIYAGGDWFIISAVPTVFGLSVLFLPYVLYQLPLWGAVSRHKGLLSMAADTLLLYALIFVCGIYAGNPGYWRPAFLITTLCISFPWLLFLIIRYGKGNVLTKAGLCVIWTTLFTNGIDGMLRLILDGKIRFAIVHANLSLWNNDWTINGNVYLLILVVGLVLGTLLLAAGYVYKKHREK